MRELRTHRLSKLVLPGLAALAALAGTQSSAAVFTSPVCDAGVNNIPDEGTLTCDILVTDLGSILAGNRITVSLIGLQHEASGDLVAIVTHLSADQSTTYGSGSIFDRIGKTSSDPNDFGFSAQFGDVTGTGDNYTFNSGFSEDLWAIAGLLGASDFIPGAAQGSTGYWTTGQFDPAATGFSSLFAGQPVAGLWRLTISDNAAGPTAGSTGSLLQWELTIDESALVPEPSQTLMLALALLAGTVTRARKKR